MTKPIETSALPPSENLSIRQWLDQTNQQYADRFSKNALDNSISYFYPPSGFDPIKGTINTKETVSNDRHNNSAWINYIAHIKTRIAILFGLPTYLSNLAEEQSWANIARQAIGLNRERAFWKNFFVVPVFTLFTLITCLPKIALNVLKFFTEVVPYYVQSLGGWLAFSLTKTAFNHFSEMSFTGFVMGLGAAIFAVPAMLFFVASYAAYYVGRSFTAPISSLREDWKDGKSSHVVLALFYTTVRMLIIAGIYSTIVAFAAPLIAPYVVAFAPAWMVPVINGLSVAAAASFHFTGVALGAIGISSTLTLQLGVLTSVFAAVLTSVSTALSGPVRRLAYWLHDESEQEKDKVVLPSNEPIAVENQFSALSKRDHVNTITTLITSPRKQSTNPPLAVAAVADDVQHSESESSLAPPASSPVGSQPTGATLVDTPASDMQPSVLEPALTSTASLTPPSRKQIYDPARYQPVRQPSSVKDAAQSSSLLSEGKQILSILSQVVTEVAAKYSEDVSSVFAKPPATQTLDVLAANEAPRVSLTESNLPSSDALTSQPLSEKSNDELTHSLSIDDSSNMAVQQEEDARQESDAAESISDNDEENRHDALVRMYLEASKNEPNDLIDQIAERFNTIDICWENYHTQGNSKWPVILLYQPLLDYQRCIVNKKINELQAADNNLMSAKANLKLIYNNQHDVKQDNIDLLVTQQYRFMQIHIANIDNAASEIISLCSKLKINQDNATGLDAANVAENNSAVKTLQELEAEIQEQMKEIGQKWEEFNADKMFSNSSVNKELYAKLVNKYLVILLMLNGVVEPSNAINCILNLDGGIAILRAEMFTYLQQTNTQLPLDEVKKLDKKAYELINQYARQMAINGEMLRRLSIKLNSSQPMSAEAAIPAVQFSDAVSESSSAAASASSSVSPTIEVLSEISSAVPALAASASSTLAPTSSLSVDSTTAAAANHTASFDESVSLDSDDDDDKVSVLINELPRPTNNDAHIALFKKIEELIGNIKEQLASMDAIWKSFYNNGVFKISVGKLYKLLMKQQELMRVSIPTNPKEREKYSRLIQNMADEIILAKNDLEIYFKRKNFHAAKAGEMASNQFGLVQTHASQIFCIKQSIEQLCSELKFNQEQLRTVSTEHVSYADENSNLNETIQRLKAQKELQQKKNHEIREEFSANASSVEMDLYVALVNKYLVISMLLSETDSNVSTLLDSLINLDGDIAILRAKLLEEFHQSHSQLLLDQIDQLESQTYERINSYAHQTSEGGVELERLSEELKSKEKQLCLEAAVPAVQSLPEPSPAASSASSSISPTIAILPEINSAVPALAASTSSTLAAKSSVRVDSTTAAAISPQSSQSTSALSAVSAQQSAQENSTSPNNDDVISLLGGAVRTWYAGASSLFASPATTRKSSSTISTPVSSASSTISTQQSEEPELESLPIPPVPAELVFFPAVSSAARFAELSPASSPNRQVKPRGRREENASLVAGLITVPADSQLLGTSGRYGFSPVSSPIKQVAPRERRAETNENNPRLVNRKLSP